MTLRPADPRSRKEFLIASYAQFLSKNKFVFIIAYPNYDKSIKQLRKDLFMKNIYIEVLVSKVFTRHFLPLGGPSFAIGMSI